MYIVITSRLYMIMLSASQTLLLLHVGDRVDLDTLTFRLAALDDDLAGPFGTFTRRDLDHDLGVAGDLVHPDLEPDLGILVIGNVDRVGTEQQYAVLLDKDWDGGEGVVFLFDPAGARSDGVCPEAAVRSVGLVSERDIDSGESVCACSPSPLALWQVKVGGIVREHGGD